MTGPALRRELASVLLALAAVFVAGALLFQRPPIDGACLDATGVFGPVGTIVRCGFVTLIGVPGTALVAVGALLVALQLLGIARQERQERTGALALDIVKDDAQRPMDRRTSHLAVLATGVVLLVPIAIALALGGTRDPGWLSATGLWGGFVGHYLHKYLGAVGGWVLWTLALSVLTVLTVRWNPLRALVGSAQRKAGAVRVTASAAPEQPSASRQTLAERLAPDPSEMPVIDPALARSLRDDAPLAITDEPEPPVVDPPARAARSRPRVDTGAEASARAVPVAALEDGMLRDPQEGAAFDDELPPTSLLTAAPQGRDDGNRDALDDAGRKLMATLKTFKVDGELVGRTTGPTVTQFEIEPAAGVKVRQIAALSDDIALAMRAPSIRIVAPIPGRGAVGVEVPNPSPQTVFLREVLESRDFQSARAALPVALGIDLEGKPVVADLARMPHLLIAGATGSGKSVCVNTIITSLVYRHTPKTLRFLMVDPKMVELSVYNTLPHLRHKVITDNRDAAAVLKWAVLEMQERYRLLEANGCRNLQEFNKRVTDHEVGSGPAPQKPRTPEIAFEDRTYTGGVLPYLVVVIDEMADLMMTVQAQVETPIAMLAQKARAIGIHLILATQRPSVNVITGLIKANFPCRIAFRVASQVDSRTIIDGAGAEALLGNGDMLFTPPGRSEPSRLQGAFLSSEETDRVMRWYGDLSARRGAAMDDEEPDVLETVRALEAAADGGGDEESAPDGERDSRFREAAEIVLQQRQGSTSLLQRKMKVGYGRAARLIDQLEDAGVLSPSEGPSRPREVLISAADLDRICGE